MAQLKRVYLLFLSYVGSIFFCLPQGSGTETDIDTSRRYAFEITMEKGEISGMLIAKEGNGAIVGTMINEFGVTALSFVYDRYKHKLKLMDVMGMLDKWYIKRVLKKDLIFCIHILYGTPYDKKHHYIISQTATDTSVTNAKRKITYLFKPIGSESENETI